MKIVKIIGIVVLAVFSISGAIRVMSYGLYLTGSFGQLAPETMSETIGHLIGAVLIETLIVAGLVKLVRSMKKIRVPDAQAQG